MKSSRPNQGKNDIFISFLEVFQKFQKWYVKWTELRDSYVK